VIKENGGDAAETRLAETFVSWNRPHKLTLNMDFRFENETPGALKWARQAGLNIYIAGTSGRAYTPMTWVAPSTPDGGWSMVTAGEPNSENAPIQITTDIRLNRWFRMMGQRFDIGFTGTNIFNNYLIYRIDPVTGKGRVWGQGSYDWTKFAPSDRTPTALAYKYTSEIADPSNYGPGAQWRLSLDVDF
jgi:hypothetical protein